MNDHRPARHHRPMLGCLAVVAVVVAALAVAAAVVGEPADRGAASPLGLPWRTIVLGADALTGAGVAVAALLGVAIVWALATTPRRREFGARPWWHTPLVMTIVAIVTLLLSWQLDRGWLAERFAELAGSRELFAPGSSERLPTSGMPVEQVVDPGVRRNAALAGALLVLLGGGAWSWWWLRRGRHVEPEPAEDLATARFAEAVDAALDDLDTHADARQAILRCYAHLDAALASAGCTRRAAETAREHRHRAAATLGQAARAAAGLVDRFERARYDVSPVSEDDRREAVAALHDVRATLAAARAAAGEPSAAAARPRP
jgi:hypothetical protein